MKIFLMLCAIAAFATALPSDDVDEVVPETNFAEETVGGHWTDCKLGNGDCAKATIYTTSRVHHCKSKKACTYKFRQVNGKFGKKVHCSKWAPRNCEQWGGMFNAHAARDGVVGHIPFCHEINSEKRTLCKCKGAHQDWKGKGKACFKGPNPKETIHCFSKRMLFRDGHTGKPVYHKHAGKCMPLKYKQGKWSPSEIIMGSCNHNGYAWASTCSYPKGIKRKAPKKAKVCACHVKGYNTKEVIHLKEGHGKKHGKYHYKVFDWHKPGRGAQVKSFREITCQGCGKVELHDNDHRGKDNKVMQCCGKKVCHFKAKGHIGSHGWDLQDDVSRIDLIHPC